MSVEDPMTTETAAMFMRQRDDALADLDDMKRQRDDARERVHILEAENERLRQRMTLCADKLEMVGNREPGEVAKVLRGLA